MHTGQGLYESELQQRALELLKMSDSSLGSKPSLSPRANPSATAAMLTPNTKLLHTCKDSNPPQRKAEVANQADGVHLSCMLSRLLSKVIYAVLLSMTNARVQSMACCGTA